MKETEEGNGLCPVGVPHLKIRKSECLDIDPWWGLDNREQQQEIRDREKDDQQANSTDNPEIPSDTIPQRNYLATWWPLGIPSDFCGWTHTSVMDLTFLP